MRAGIGDSSKFWRLPVLGDFNAYIGSDTPPGKHPYPMCQWIAANATARKYPVVVNVGDWVNAPGVTAQSDAAKACFAYLRASGLPVITVDGNHDVAVSYGQLTSWFAPGGKVSDLQSNFPTWLRSYSELYFGAEPSSYAQCESSYHQFTAGGRTWGAITLGWFPGIYPPNTYDQVLWAKAVCEEYPTVPKILVTHAFTYRDGTRYDWATKNTAQEYNPHNYGAPGDATRYDGQQMWDAFVKLDPTIKIVLSGHDSPNLGYLTSERADGSKCHQFGVSHFEIVSGGTATNRSFVELEIDPSNDTITRRVIAPASGAEIVSAFPNVTIQNAGIR